MKKKIFVLTMLLINITGISDGLFAQQTEKSNRKEQVEELYREQEMLKQVMEKKKRDLMEAEAKANLSREEAFFYGQGKGSGVVITGSGRTGQNISTFSLTKTLKDETLKKDYKVFVDSAMTKVNISVTVTCERGSIEITLYTPDGGKVNNISFTSSERAVWKQTFSVDKSNEKERKKYYGNWQFRVQAKEASGTYRISVKSY